MDNPYSRGSIWRKWDLQVQTILDDGYVSLDQYYETIKDSDPTAWEKYIAQVGGENKALLYDSKAYFADTTIPKTERCLNYVRNFLAYVETFDSTMECIGITDHNYFDDHLIDAFVNYSERTRCKILPGVEINCQGIHMILFFSKKLYGKDSFSEGIHAFLIKFNIDTRTTRGVLTTTSSDIKKIIDEVNKNEGIVVYPHCNSDNGLFQERTKTDRTLLADIYNHQKVNLLQSQNKQVCVAVENYIKTNPSLKSDFCFHISSDSRSLKDIGKADKDNNFLWIKADPTFDGLKQVICEPVERVHVGMSVTKSKNDANVIDSVVIKNSNRWFEEEPILLNDNLVTIIGEKGAGKTALADLIALAAGDFDIEAAKSESGSFVSKALKSTKQIQETIDKCSVTVHWRDKTSNNISISKDFKEYREHKKVRYLSQSFIEKKCHPERTGELQEEIENIIFQHIQTRDRIGQTTFLELKQKKTQSIQVNKARVKGLIGTLNDEIAGIEDEIDSLKGKKDEREELKVEVKQLKEQKPKPQTETEKKIEDILALLNSRKNKLDESIADLNLKLSIIETIKVKMTSLKEYIELELSDIKTDLKSVDLLQPTDELKFSIEPEFETKLESKKGEIEAEIKKLEGAEEDQEIGAEDTEEAENSKEEQLEDLDLLTEEFISTLELKRVSSLISLLEGKSSIAVNARATIKAFDEKIELNQKRIDELEKAIKNIEDVKKPLLPTKKKDRDTAHKSYFTLLQEEKTILEGIYSSLKKKLNRGDVGGKNDLDFFARVELNVDAFLQKADGVIDFGRKGTYCRNKNLLFSETKTLAETIEIGEESDVHSLVMKLYKTFEECDEKPISIKSQLLEGKGKKRLDFYKWIFDVSDFKVAYSIKYRETNIELLSPGKKGIVLLLMYLALDTESSIPLIIDQPEENLDNKSLYPNLVDYFKIAKRRRQIIIITHNPNLVLNTDAEQIIVANFEAVPSVYKARITYASGAIENSYINKQLDIPLFQQGIREHGSDILEGGKVAFIKRKNRYEY